MKKSILLLPILLVGCSGKPELRKDIKEFISQFSLEAALQEYVSGGYISTREESENGLVKKEVIEMEYTTNDPEHPTYVELTTNYENDVVTSTVEVRFVENDDGTFLSTNGELKPYTVKQCGDLITKFFYKTVDIDGQYHTQGYYYGDYLKEVAAGLQKYVTIDQDNQLYIHDYSVRERDADISQRYVVNKWGMLVSNHLRIENETKYLQQDILVHN